MTGKQLGSNGWVCTRLYVHNCHFEQRKVSDSIFPLCLSVGLLIARLTPEKRSERVKEKAAVVLNLRQAAGGPR